MLRNKITSTENYCVSDFVADDYHTDKYRENNSVLKINFLLEEELQFLYLRIAGLKEIEGKSICDYHYEVYQFLFISCDPWNGYAKKISHHLKIIGLKFSEKV